MVKHGKKVFYINLVIKSLISAPLVSIARAAGGTRFDRTRCEGTRGFQFRGAAEPKVLEVS